MNSETEIQVDLMDWVEQKIVGNDALSWDISAGFTPVSGDAGFRVYFRLEGSVPPLLAVYSPPSTEKNVEFVSIAKLLLKGGVLAPELFAQNLEKGFLLISDFGDQLLLPVLSSETVDDFYGVAMDTMVAMQAIDCKGAGLEAYDAAKLLQEMVLFPDWFVTQLLDHPLTESERALNEWVFQLLQEMALEQPQVFVHRDFHSRNLLVLPDHQLGVIDFQDAVIGPITYDSVSLFRDCYVHWSEARVKTWVREWQEHLVAADLLEATVSHQQFDRWFDWMGLQRHIKVLGIFARLSLRDEKHGYLEDLPLVIHYTLSVARRYEALAEWVAWFEASVMPLVRQQPWFSEEAL